MIYLTIIYLLFLHFVGDFAINHSNMKKKKDSRVEPIFLHLLVYFIVMMFGSFFLFSNLFLTIYFSFFAISLHYSIDFLYFKGVDKLSNSEKSLLDQPLYWVIEGLSQFSMQAGLILIYIYLIN